MKKDMDKIILESRLEIDLLQNVVEIAYACGDCNDEEKAIAKKLSALLDEMYYSF
ncbi:MAG: hypothetical protein ACK5ML_01135 [Lachnospiraceae bacterium]